MKENNELYTIEKRYEVSKVKVNKLYAWPILRQRIYFEIFTKKVNFTGKLRTRSKRVLVKNLFYGFALLFKLKKFDYLFFNNADKRTLTIKNKQYDVFFDAWADKVGQDKSLFIEWAIDKHFSSKKTYSQHVISDLFFKLGCFIVAFFTKIITEELVIIEKISNDYNIKIDPGEILKNRFAEIKFYRKLFRYLKPKTIFLISSFTKETIVIAAHLENIKVYETQHGYIGGNHQFYNSYYKFGKLYYPDYLLSFGKHEKENLPKDFIFNPNNIIPVGSLFLERIKDTYSNKELELLTKPYEYIFCVTLQNVKEEILLNWVCEQAKLHNNWLFIIKPRHVRIDYSKYLQLNNCIMLLNYSIYEILKYSNYNITIYSTTAIEATVFNAKTLFYNIDKLSVKYFDVAAMDAALIDVGKNIDKEHLRLDKSSQDSYFAFGYFNNITNTTLYS